jgi:hypothetical protein
MVGKFVGFRSGPELLTANLNLPGFLQVPETAHVLVCTVGIPTHSWHRDVEIWFSGLVYHSPDSKAHDPNFSGLDQRIWRAYRQKRMISGVLSHAGLLGTRYTRPSDL